MKPTSHGSQPPLVLCVDDDPAVLSLLATALKSRGYAVVTATDDRGALEKFSSAAVDAVVLDYNMPGLSGVQLARKLKHLNPLVPKVLFTAYTNLPHKAWHLVEGFCSKADGTRGLLTRLDGLVRANPATSKDAATLAMHIAVARFRPDWDARADDDEEVLRKAAC